MCLRASEGEAWQDLSKDRQSPTLTVRALLPTNVTSGIHTSTGKSARTYAIGLYCTVQNGIQYLMISAMIAHITIQELLTVLLSLEEFCAHCLLQEGDIFLLFIDHIVVMYTVTALISRLPLLMAELRCGIYTSTETLFSHFFRGVDAA